MKHTQLATQTILTLTSYQWKANHRNKTTVKYVPIHKNMFQSFFERNKRKIHSRK